jgi:hypothetical protein
MTSPGIASADEVAAVLEIERNRAISGDEVLPDVEVRFLWSLTAGDDVVLTEGVAVEKIAHTGEGTSEKFYAGDVLVGA